MSLTGQIEEMGLGAVIQTLSLNRYMGTLRIETEDAGSQFFFISEGSIVLVRQVTRDPVRLGDLLIRAGKITQADLESALATQKETKLRLGEQLVSDGLVEQDQIERVIQSKFEEDFLDLFLLDKGRFEFIFGLTPEALFAPDEKLERVTLNTSGLMLEAMRRVDEWQDMINSLGSLDTIFTNHGRPPGDEVIDQDVKGIALLADARRKLYDLLDGELSMREVLGQAISRRVASRLETFLFLHHLCETKAVQPLDPRTLLNHARGALSAKDVPKAAKYIRAILGRKGQLEIGLIKRYLEFLRKNRRPKLAFDEARMFAGQALTRGETKQAIALYEEAVALEYRNLEVIDRLFYALLRDNQRERAIEVGLMLRDYLSADADLQVATRVVRNLKELDPENPAVLELSGLVLQRKEQNERAIVELEAALSRADSEHPRRGSIVGALLELQPERDDLRAEQESIEVREARLAVQREFRRRMILVSTVPTAVILGLLTIWRGYQELNAKGYLEQAEELYASGPGDDYTNYEEASRALDHAKLNSWLYASAAEELQEEIEEKISIYKSSRKEELDELIRERLAQQEAQQREEQERLERAQLGAALAEYKLYVSRRDWVQASAKALEIQAKFAQSSDPRVKELAVYVELFSEPAGAQVFHGEEELGKTPLAVALRPAEEAVLELRASGYRPLQRKLTPRGHQELTLTLEVGPSWSVALPEPPLAPLSWEQGVVVVTPAGRVVSLDFDEGSLRWAAEVREALAARSLPPESLTWAHVFGERLFAGSDAVVLAFDLTSGAVRWAHELPGSGSSRAVSLEAAGAAYLAVARGSLLSFWDDGTGEARGELQLPAAAHLICQGDESVFVLDVDGRLHAVELASGSPRLGWSSEPQPEVAELQYSSLAQAVLLRRRERVVGLVPDGASFTLEPEVGELAGMALVEDRLYLVAPDGTLVGLRVPDGQLLVPALKVANEAAAGPVSLGASLFLADGVGNLLRLDRDGRPSGELLSLGGRVSAPLRVAPGKRLVAVTDRTVLLVEPGE